MTTETKVGYTKGPWCAKFGENSGYDCMTAAWNIWGENHRLIAMVDYANFNADHFDSTRIPEADANAHLIAAAPDLLEALESICNVIECETEKQSAAWEHAQAAIRKAREGG